MLEVLRVEVAVDVVVVVVGTMPGLGRMVTDCGHLTGPQLRVIEKRNLYCPLYSTWNELFGQVPTVPPGVVAFPTLGTVYDIGCLQSVIVMSAILTPESQKRPPDMAVISATVGDDPVDVQDRVMGSPCLKVPVRGPEH